ncbi:hypothetical protein JOE63_002392 [Cellulosimicrobium cellulans]|uniref:SHOCT domain-containing protein n=1 Tax=Cellulosimicrobium cellulans TaxID=1710 RepID=UPI001958A046|nr:SHOCT domain-containing protein [Cellulosimicrobium cellulans]MBM7819915.1 hypothetical protein [Cellulosimicrobium cellulans]
MSTSATEGHTEVPPPDPAPAPTVEPVAPVTVAVPVVEALAEHGPVAPAPPRRRPVGVVTIPGRAPDTSRFSAAPRYPAMFHVAGGRLVWDGARLRLVRGDDTVLEPAGRPVVTVTGDGPTVVVTWRDERPGARTTRAVLLDGSSARFARFARSLADTRPGSVVVDDRTMPSPRVPRLHPGQAGTARRPGVFARTLWRVVGRGAPAASAATGDGGAALVARLERLAALHRAGDLTDTEFARAKQALLG